MKKRKITIVHVNQLVIRSNIAKDAKEPPIIVRGKSRAAPVKYAMEVDLVLNDVVVGKFVYRPDAPLDCGARLWFETDQLEVIPHSQQQLKPLKQETI